MEKNNKVARRSLFSGLGLLAVAGVATKLVSSPPPTGPTAAPAEPDGDGYRLTEHVKKYYRTTTI